MGKSAVRFLFLCSFILILACCKFFHAAKYYYNPSNPFDDIKSIAVVPFENLSIYKGTDIDCIKRSDIFASELAQFKGFQVWRPMIVNAQMQKNNLKIKNADDVIDLGKTLGVDAVVVGGITEYDPYYPPRVGLAVQVFVTSEKKAKGLDLSKLAQCGKPYELPLDDCKKPVVAIERIYDSHQLSIRREVKGYAYKHEEEEDSPFPQGDEFLYVVDKYFSFVSNKMIREIIDLIENAKEQERERLAKEEGERRKLRVESGE